MKLRNRYKQSPTEAPHLSKADALKTAWGFAERTGKRQAATALLLGAVAAGLALNHTEPGVSAIETVGLTAVGIVALAAERESSKKGIDRAGTGYNRSLLDFEPKPNHQLAKDVVAQIATASTMWYPVIGSQEFVMAAQGANNIHYVNAAADVILAGFAWTIASGPSRAQAAELQKQIMPPPVYSVKDSQPR